MAVLLATAALTSPLASPASGQSPSLEPPARPTGLTGETAHDQVKLTWDDPGDASISGYRVLRRDPEVDASGVFSILVDNTGTAFPAYVDREVRPEKRYIYRIQARNAAGLSSRSGRFVADTPAALVVRSAPVVPGERPVARAQQTCPGGEDSPEPVAVPVTAVPIVVTSTTAEYFVLYATFDADGTEVDLPVLVKKGEASTTTLAENVAALPVERYRVEKYLIADPADVDGDCIDDLTELGSFIHEQPRESWIGVPFPPLVDDDIWEQAQAVRARRRIRSSRNTKVFHLLQHLVRCSECGLLMGPLAKRRQTVRRGGKTYRYDFDTPRRYYQCYGMKAPHSLRCRERPMIRAQRLESLVWDEVKRVLEHPDLIVAGLAALDGDADDDVAGEVARTERELAGVQLEEDRAIRLYVTGKITEEQLDHQRRFIGERLERLRARLDEYRTRASAHVDQRLVLERVVEWTQRVGDGLDDLPDEERRELLNLLLDEATIDGENNVTLTLAIPGDGDVVSIAEQGPSTTRCPYSGRCTITGPEWWCVMRHDPSSRTKTLVA